MYEKPRWYVTIYCAAPSHSESPWVIGTWVPAVVHKTGLWWRSHSELWLNGAFVRQREARHDATRTVIRTERGDELVDVRTERGRSRQGELQGETILPVRLQCHLCGERVKRSDAKFSRDLSEIAARLGEGGWDLTLQQYRSLMDALH